MGKQNPFQLDVVSVRGTIARLRNEMDVIRKERDRYVPVDRFSVSVDSYHFGNLINYQNWGSRQNVLDIAKRYMNP